MTEWKSKLGNTYLKTEIEAYDSQSLLNRLRKIPANQSCADCGEKSTPWASVNLGVFLCIKCGSIHRGLGTHISKPKGCLGTYLWGPDEIERMTYIGNERAKRLYGDSGQPGPDAGNNVWATYIREKYELLKFAPEPASDPTVLPDERDESKTLDLIYFDGTVVVDFFEEYGL